MGCASSTPTYDSRPSAVVGMPVNSHAPHYGTTPAPSYPAPAAAANGRPPNIVYANNNGGMHPAKCFEAGLHDIHVLVDDSSSMRPIWREAMEGVEALLIEALKYDKDGVEVSFLNNHDTFHVNSVADVVRVFNTIMPVGTTPTAEALRRITDAYWKGFNAKAPKKPVSIVVVTDGCPNDPQAVESAIVGSARKMQSMNLAKGQLGITFVGIGINKGSSAYHHLMALDQDMAHKYGIPDIVDCSSLDEDDGSPLKYRLVKCLFGGVDASLDALHE